MKVFSQYLETFPFDNDGQVLSGQCLNASMGWTNESVTELEKDFGNRSN